MVTEWEFSHYPVKKIRDYFKKERIEQVVYCNLNQFQVEIGSRRKHIAVAISQ